MLCKTKSHSRPRIYNLGSRLGSKQFDGYHHDVINQCINNIKEDCGLGFSTGKISLNPTNVMLDIIVNSIKNTNGMLLGLQKADSIMKNHLAIKTKLPDFTLLPGSNGLAILYDHTKLQYIAKETGELTAMLKAAKIKDNDDRVQLAVIKQEAADIQFIFINVHLEHKTPYRTQCYINQLLNALLKNQFEAYSVVMIGNFNAAFANYYKGPTSLCMLTPPKTKQPQVLYKQTDHALFKRAGGDIEYLKTDVINPVDYQINEDPEDNLSADVVSQGLALNMGFPRREKKELSALQQSLNQLIGNDIWTVHLTQDGNGVQMIGICQNDTNRNNAQLKNKIEQVFSVQPDTRYGDEHPYYILPLNTALFQTYLEEMMQLAELSQLLQEQLKKDNESKKSFIESLFSSKLTGTESKVIAIQNSIATFNLNAAIMELKKASNLPGVLAVHNQILSLFSPTGTD